MEFEWSQNIVSCVYRKWNSNGFIYKKYYRKIIIWVEPTGNIAEFDKISAAIFNSELFQKAFLRFQIRFLVID